MESCWCVHLVTGDRVVTLAPVILSSLITVDDNMVKCPSVVTRYREREREREREEPTAGGGVLITVLHLRETLAQKTLTPSSGGCTLSMQNTVMSEWYTGGERERKTGACKWITFYVFFLCFFLFLWRRRLHRRVILSKERGRECGHTKNTITLSRWVEWQLAFDERIRWEREREREKVNLGYRSSKISTVKWLMSGCTRITYTLDWDAAVGGEEEDVFFFLHRVYLQ